MMPERGLIRGLMFVFFLLLLAGSALGATLHGTIYDIELNEMNDVVVTVDSTPQQRYVSKDGMYTFELNQGDYELTAEYISSTGAIYTSTDTVSIKDQGDYVFDLFLFPDIDADDEELLTETYDMEEVEELAEEDEEVDWYVAVVLAIAIIVSLIVYLYLKAKTRQLENDMHADESVLEALKKKQIKKSRTHGSVDVDDDLKQVLDIIKSEGGRTTQKELRRQIPLSEAKISLMVAELEHKGKIEKIKKGRGNIIRLKK